LQGRKRRKEGRENIKKNRKESNKRKRKED
jgi:hypothetical protein